MSAEEKIGTEPERESITSDIMTGLASCQTVASEISNNLDTVLSKLFGQSALAGINAVDDRPDRAGALGEMQDALDVLHDRLQSTNENIGSLIDRL